MPKAIITEGPAGTGKSHALTQANTLVRENILLRGPRTDSFVKIERPRDYGMFTDSLGLAQAKDTMNAMGFAINAYLAIPFTLIDRYLVSSWVYESHRSGKKLDGDTWQRRVFQNAQLLSLLYHDHQLRNNGYTFDVREAISRQPETLELHWVIALPSVNYLAQTRHKGRQSGRAYPFELEVEIDLYTQAADIMSKAIGKGTRIRTPSYVNVDLHLSIVHLEEFYPEGKNNLLFDAIRAACYSEPIPNDNTHQVAQEVMTW